MSLVVSLALAACNPGSVTVPGEDLADGGSDGTPGLDTDEPIDEPDVLVTFGGVEAALVEAYPTVVRVQWVQDAEATVFIEFSFDGEPVRTSPERLLGEGPHEELILGVPYDTDVQWRLVATNGAGKATSDQHATRTGPTHPSMPLGEVWSSDPGGWDADMEYTLVSVSEGTGFSSGSWTMLVDRQGRVVWGHRAPQGSASMHPRISWHGDSFLIDHDTFWSSFDGGDGSTIHELKIDGTVVQQWATPGLHHPFTDMPDGTIAWTDYQNGNDVVLLLRPNGDVEELFRCADWADAVGEWNYCGSNTLSYNEQRDVFLLSLFTYDTVIELDASAGTPLRWFGASPGSYAFSPPNSQFDYQHGSYYTEDGTLLVSTHSSDSTSELAVREYQVDEVNERLVEVWNFGIGLGVDGTQMGEAHRLPSGNVLHNYGYHAVLREGTFDGDVVWDIRWEDSEYGSDDGHTVGRSAPITDSLWTYAPERM